MDKHKASEADLLRDNSIIGQNRKSKISEEQELSSKSMLKKNEMSLVLLGAGVLTFIVFFVFLRPSGDLESSSGAGDDGQLAAAIQALEGRLTNIEQALQTFDTARMALTLNGEEGQGEASSDMSVYTARVERVETALSVKFDILTTRVDKMENRLSSISKDVARNVMTTKGVAGNQTSNSSGSPASVKKKTPAKQLGSVQKKSAHPPAKTAVVTKQKTVEKAVAPAKKQVKSTLLYHVIAKGDTLYNISKKYNTTVPLLREINNMTPQDAIIIGQKIVVKQ